MGAMCTLAALTEHAEAAALAGGLLLRAVRGEGPVNLRNAATVGGAVACAEYDSEFYAALLALGASVTVLLTSSAPHGAQLGPANARRSWRKWGLCMASCWRCRSRWGRLAGARRALPVRPRTGLSSPRWPRAGMAVCASPCAAWRSAPSQKGCRSIRPTILRQAVSTGWRWRASSPGAHGQSLENSERCSRLRFLLMASLIRWMCSPANCCVRPCAGCAISASNTATRQARAGPMRCCSPLRPKSCFLPPGQQRRHAGSPGRWQAIITVEGLSGPRYAPYLAGATIARGAIQCGYCTFMQPLAAKRLLDETPNPTEAQVREAIAGVLCCCTGYAAGRGHPRCVSRCAGKSRRCRSFR